MDLSLPAIVGVLLLYGVFAGLFEVTSKSWIVNVLPAHAKATGVGLAGSITSLGFLGACLITGLLWSQIGSADTLAILAMCTIIPIAYFSFVTIKEKHDEQPAT